MVNKSNLLGAAKGLDIPNLTWNDSMPATNGVRVRARAQKQISCVWPETCWTYKCDRPLHLRLGCQL